MRVNRDHAESSLSLQSLAHGVLHISLYSHTTQVVLVNLYLYYKQQGYCISPISDPSLLGHIKWLNEESSPSPSGQVLLLQADGFWLTVRTLLDSCHSQSMQTGSEAITHSWEIMATKNNTWSVSTFAGSEYTPAQNIHRRITVPAGKQFTICCSITELTDSVNVICLSQTMMPYI